MQKSTYRTYNLHVVFVPLLHNALLKSA